MIAMSTVLEDTNPFSTVLGFASMLGEDGRAMHKSWGNSIEFNEGADKIGVDVMRWSFVRHNPERNLLFGYKMTSEVKRQFHMILWNSYRFFANNVCLEPSWQKNPEFVAKNTIDTWILARLNETINLVGQSLDNHSAFSATEAIEKFVSDFSTWFIRRSRDRVGPAAMDENDKDDCYQTFQVILEKLSIILSPFMPFMAELIYTNLTGEESVHLASWPVQSELSQAEESLVSNMEKLREVVEIGHSQRKANAIAVKQALSSITISSNLIEIKNNLDLQQLIADELNVEKVLFADQSEDTVVYDLNITESLKNKGLAREIIRNIQEARKNAGCGYNEFVDVVLPGWPSSEESYIKRKTLVSNLITGESVAIIRVDAKK